MSWVSFKVSLYPTHDSSWAPHLQTNSDDPAKMWRNQLALWGMVKGPLRDEDFTKTLQGGMKVWLVWYCSVFPCFSLQWCANWPGWRASVLPLTYARHGTIKKFFPEKARFLTGELWVSWAKWHEQQLVNPTGCRYFDYLMNLIIWSYSVTPFC